MILQISPRSKRMFHTMKILIIIRHTLRRNNLVCIRLKLRRERGVYFWCTDLHWDTNLVDLGFGEPGRMRGGDACQIM